MLTDIYNINKIKNNIAKYIVLFVVIILVSNIPIVSFFLSFFTGNLTMMGPDHHYISGKGGFSVWGRDSYEDIQR